MSSEDGNSVFAITYTKLYVPIVTLSAEDKVKLSNLLGGGFKRPIYWNKYKVIPKKTYDANGYMEKIITLKLKVGIFMIKQLMTQLSNMMK